MIREGDVVEIPLPRGRTAVGWTADRRFLTSKVGFFRPFLTLQNELRHSRQKHSNN